MRFEARAYANGEIVSLMVDAISQEDALQQMAARPVRLLSLREITLPLSGLTGSASPRFDLPLFSQELLSLLEAGLSIIEAIDTLAERGIESGSQRVMVRLAASLREGHSLSAAVETMPEIFPMLFIGIVRSSERTGDLPESLARYIDYRTRLDALRSRIISATIYPVLLLVVGALVTLFLGGYVIPRFAAVYKSTGRSLPWASALLLDWGTFANSHMTELLVGAALLAAAAIIALHTLSRRGGFAVLLARIPFLSGRLRIYELSRLYLTLGMLLDSGLPIMQALALAEASLPAHQRLALQNARALIRSGEKLSSSFARAKLTTAVGLRMMRIGEESGRLGEMMARAARFHDDETARWIDRFSRAAEPLLMVAIGAVIGTLVVLLYMPVFDLAGSFR